MYTNKIKSPKSKPKYKQKCFQDLLSQHFFFGQINLNKFYLVQITYYFEFLMIKSISFIVLTQFFQFNQLKFLRQPGYLIFQVKPTIFSQFYK